MEQFKVSDLQGHPRNPRKISDEQLTMLQKSLHEFGDLSGFVFNRKKGRLVGGHMRGRSMPEGQIAIEKRYETPTRTGTIAEGYVEIEGERHKYREVSWEEERETAAMIAANQHGGTWDFPTLAEHLVRMDEINLDPQLLGFTSAEIEDIMTYAPEQKEPGCPEDEVPSARAEPNIKRGEIYALGNHRLMCGDSTCAEDIEKLMSGEKAEMLLTDPPYNVGFEYNSYGDNKTCEEYFSFCCKWFLLAKEITDFQIITPGTVNLCMWAKILPWKSIAPWIKKNSMNNGEVSFLRLWEPIIFYGSPPERRSTDLFEFNLSQEKIEHSCPKPVALFEELSKSFGSVSKIYEPFCGSGTTLIACEKTNKRCFAMEQDPVYCQVILDRYVKFTGKEPTQIK